MDLGLKMILTTLFTQVIMEVWCQLNFAPGGHFKDEKPINISRSRVRGNIFLYLAEETCLDAGIHGFTIKIKPKF